jgi:arginase
MDPKSCIVVGAPVQNGASMAGCEMGPSALRIAGALTELRSLGYAVQDRGDVAPTPLRQIRHPNTSIKALAETIAWTEALAEAAYRASGEGVAIFLGGDHSLSAGTMTGVARQAAQQQRELFVLWLDSHPDLHSLDTTTSGNLHGVPMAYALGFPGFEGYFPPVSAPLVQENVCMMGLRSLDPPERALLRDTRLVAHDMRAIDEHGVVPLLKQFLAQTEARDGIIHVSLDVDFLDPEIAPGVGTTVPGGATFREAHLIMEMLHDSGRVRSIDLVELNPFLDERGRTALLMVDLLASLMGRRVLDRPTLNYGYGRRSGSR